MAKAMHLKILKRGVKEWNEWRKENPLEKPDLQKADLRDANLIDINFYNANLFGANFNNANLIRARFDEANLENAKMKQANLSDVNFEWARLVRADLRNAYLGLAKFWGTNLRCANLRCANLWGSNFCEHHTVQTNLTEADLQEANLSFTRFENVILDMTNFKNSIFIKSLIIECDLSKAINLEYAEHQGPSNITIDTILTSNGNIPNSFLRGCGVPNYIIETLLPPARKSIIEFYTCFISYSVKDEIFAKKIKNDLEAKNIRCWFFPDDATWGKDVYKNIDEAIRIYDKLIVICSENSLNSEAVLREIERGLQKEKASKEKHKETKRVLFPITIDDYVFEKLDHYLKPDLKRITVGDFKDWKDPDKYKEALERLVRGMQK